MFIDVDSTKDNISSLRPISCTLTDRTLDHAEPRLASTQITKKLFSLEIIGILVPTRPPTKYPSPALLLTLPYNHPKPAPSTMPPKLYSVSPSDIANMHLQDMLDICPCITIPHQTPGKTLTPSSSTTSYVLTVSATASTSRPPQKFHSH